MKKIIYLILTFIAVSFKANGQLIENQNKLNDSTKSIIDSTSISNGFEKETIPCTKRPIVAPPLQNDDSQTYFDKLDAALEPNIAATLAGLSLAALALIISLVSAQITKMGKDYEEELDSGNESPHKEKNRTKLKKLKSSVFNLKWSFYCFVGFLAETLTIDIWEEKNGFLNPYSFAEPLDLVLSGGLLSFGIYFLTVGAKKMGDSL